jgi:hypothetical protein
MREDIINMVGVPARHSVSFDTSLLARDQTRWREVTPAALARLAYAEAYFYGIQFLQLRSEPSLLRSIVEEQAAECPELIPDANRNAPTLESLLSNSRFVSQKTRFAIHNHLIHVGTWSTIAKYLQDVVKLDRTKGRLGAEAERAYLMSSARELIEQEAECEESRLRSAIAAESSLPRVWIREFVRLLWIFYER